MCVTAVSSDWPPGHGLLAVDWGQSQRPCRGLRTKRPRVQPSGPVAPRFERRISTLLFYNGFETLPLLFRNNWRPAPHRRRETNSLFTKVTQTIGGQDQGCEGAVLNLCVLLCIPQHPRPTFQTQHSGGRQQQGEAIGGEQQAVAGEARERCQRVSSSCLLSSTRRLKFKQEAFCG